MSENMECDRCGATIVLDHFEQPTPINLAFDVSDADDQMMYEQETRVLCSGCEEDLLEWIDAGDIDREDCVDLPSHVEAARALDETGERLEQLAEALRTDLDPDADEA